MTRRDPSAAAGTPEYINLSPGSSRRLSLSLLPYPSHHPPLPLQSRCLSVGTAHAIPKTDRETCTRGRAHTRGKKKILRVTQILTHAFSYEFVNGYLYRRLRQRRRRRRRRRSPGPYYYATVHPGGGGGGAVDVGGETKEFHLHGYFPARPAGPVLVLVSPGTGEGRLINNSKNFLRRRVQKGKNNNK